VQGVYFVHKYYKCALTKFSSRRGGVDDLQNLQKKGSPQKEGFVKEYLEKMEGNE